MKKIRKKEIEELFKKIEAYYKITQGSKGFLRYLKNLKKEELKKLR